MQYTLFPILLFIITVALPGLPSLWQPSLWQASGCKQLVYLTDGRQVLPVGRQVLPVGRQVCNALTVQSSERRTLQGTTPNAKNDIVFEEKNGIVAVEAEHFSEQTTSVLRKWYPITTDEQPSLSPDPDGNHAESASGKAYLEILPDTRTTHDDELIRGENFSNEPGQIAVLTYAVYFNTPGKYFVWVRAYSTGTEDNGIHAGIDGTWPASGQRMQWCEGKNTWTWESKQRTEENHCGEPEKIFLEVATPGLHTIHFSMREDGFEFDKWMMALVYEPPEGLGADEILKQNN